jgi:uncharacterized delta-60 repeat protein
MTTHNTVKTAPQKAGDRDLNWGPNGDGSVAVGPALGDGQHSSLPLNGAAILPDGQLIVTSEILQDKLFVIGKLDKQGMLNPAFGENGRTVGKFTQGSESRAGAVTLANNDKILMAGRYGPYVALLGLDSQGAWDQGFADKGEAIIYQFRNGAASVIKVLPDANFIVGANYATGAESTFDTATLLKFDDKGSLIASFGNEGKVEIRLPNDPTALTFLNDCAFLNDGRILVAGYAQTKDGKRQGLLAMLNANGSPNLLFGDNGGILLISRHDTDIQFNAITQRDTNRFLAAGEMAKSQQEQSIGLFRGLDDSGKPDMAFNAGEMLETELVSDKSTRWDKVYTDNNDKIVVAGIGDGLYLARFTLDGMLDPSFSDDGYVVEEVLTDRVITLAPDTDDTILLGCNHGGLVQNGALYRYFG